MVTSEDSQTTGIHRIDRMTNSSPLYDMAQPTGRVDLWDGAMKKLVP